jgi:tRNA pseudouridine55 synthase
MAGVPGWGLLVLDKPVGLSSYAAARRAARALGATRFGHAGTLDPLASGVLLVALGKATRLLEYLVCQEKEYRAVIRLGQMRHTLDREGELLETRAVPDLASETLELALRSFRGKIRQIPPSHSAIKVEGVRCYRRARRGEAVSPPPRVVEIRALQRLDWRPPDLTVQVVCSKGTYIRALARDLGEALGTGGCLWDLVRIRSGAFRLEEAVSLKTLENEALDGWGRVFPPRRMVAELQSLSVPEGEARALTSGLQIGYAEGPHGDLAVYDERGALLAVARAEGGALRPMKVFPPCA